MQKDEKKPSTFDDIGRRPRAKQMALMLLSLNIREFFHGRALIAEEEALSNWDLGV